MYVYLTMMMSVAGPIKLQMKYVSNRSQHLERQRQGEKDIMHEKQREEEQERNDAEGLRTWSSLRWM